ncbi:MAG: hypothetical protein NTW21_39320 [Verrucomicrobia bacterium]|nr:hypothetical protein [Verrucomicrobiota bacterium]
MTSTPQHPRRDPRVGFALVITLALMVLLAVLAVGLLALSSVSLRTAGQEAARSQARTNARLALALALAQLQKQTGVDSRITAPADFLKPTEPGTLANPGWCGVWRANPTTPKAYQPARSDFFTTWLVTTAEKSLAMNAARSQVPGETTVIRQAEGSPDVRIPLLAAPPHGMLGWWTEDESLKARANLPLEVPPSKGAAAAAAHAAPRTAPESLPEVVGFKPTLARTAAMVTPGQLALGATKWPDRHGLHFTTDSRSVLADVRNGGLKQDLSTLFEQTPDKITEFGQWTGAGSETNAKVYLYGPAAIAMGARWNHLYAYYNLYKEVTFSGSEPRVEPKAALIDWHLADSYDSFGDEAGGFRYPRMAKIIYLFSYTAVKDPNPSVPKPYSLQLATDVFVTLWNPFDARIHFPADTTFFAKFSTGLPMQFDWRVNGAAVGLVGLEEIIGGWFSRVFNNPSNGRQFSMGPGETVVFSFKQNPGTGSNELWPGAFFDAGITKDVVVGGTKITGAGSERISVGLKPSQHGNAGGADDQGNSQYIDFWIWDTVKKWPFYEHRGEILSRADAPFIAQMRTVNAADVPSVALKDVVGRKQPFGAFIMETKTALDSTVPIPAFLNTGTTRLSSKLTGNLAEFANERLEYKVEAVTGFDSDLIQVTLPGSPSGPNHGFIGSGRGPASGQTHFLFAAIPTVPLTSLAQFRHAGVGDGASTLRATYWGFNSTPNAPFADQSIGNSYAHPLMPPDLATKGNYLDHRYLGNEVLWDKYFLSSLAPRSAARFGTDKSMSQSWQAFLEGKLKLINSRFSPWLDSETPDTIQRRFFPSSLDSSMKKDAYKRIAAHLMLDGGFNVNSTSVEAWHAVLASTRGRAITKLAKTGGGQGQEIVGTGTVFSRTETVLADATDSPSTGPASGYCGFRDLSDENLRKLATAIVEQVRKRGPFLNLSEFLNRRLSSDPTLALSGALQSAIDASGLNDAAATGGLPGASAPGGATMAFPKASGLNTAAGSPGWLMQADVLDPLGPVIVARGDTFRIRGYGEARTAQGTVAARAWCEAVVQRLPAYMDAAETADVAIPKKPLNLLFGRRYVLVAFRWLSGPQE